MEKPCWPNVWTTGNPTDVTALHYPVATNFSVKLFAFTAIGEYNSAHHSEPRVLDRGVSCIERFEVEWGIRLPKGIRGLTEACLSIRSVAMRAFDPRGAEHLLARRPN